MTGDDLHVNTLSDSLHLLTRERILGVWHILHMCIYIFSAAVATGNGNLATVHHKRLNITNFKLETLLGDILTKTIQQVSGWSDEAASLNISKLFYTAVAVGYSVLTTYQTKRPVGTTCQAGVVQCHSKKCHSSWRIKKWGFPTFSHPCGTREFLQEHIRTGD